MSCENANYEKTEPVLTTCFEVSLLFKEDKRACAEGNTTETLMDFFEH